jgi:hypothetical protein
MIGYNDVQNYLEAIADTGDIASSPHKSFWRRSYSAFVSGLVPDILDDNGNPFSISIFNQNDPINSPFFKVLMGATTFTNGPISLLVPHMPEFGHFITEDAFMFSVNGTPVSGKQIREDLTEWLTNGFPENAPAPAMPPVPTTPPSPRAKA